MKAFIKKLSLLFAVGAMAFGSNLSHDETKANAAALGDGYTKVTNISTLINNDQVVIWCDANSYGLSGWNGSKDGKTTKSEVELIKYVVELGTNGVYLKDTVANSYIASPGTSNQFKYGSKAICTVDTNGVLKCNNRYLAVNGSYIRMYSSVGSYKPFYVYKVESVEEAGADEVIELIKSIGTVEYTVECKGLIDSARKAYDLLDDALKAEVTNYNTLLAAEAAYDVAAAEYVDELIANIEEITDYKSQIDDIRNIREVYESLTEEQKELVNNLSDLEDAEAALEAIKPLIHEIDTSGIHNSNADSLSSAANLETAYPTPDGISWTGTPSKAFGKLNTDALKLGTSSLAGYVDLKLDDSKYYITEVVVNATKYGSDTGKIVVTANDVDFTSGTLSENGSDHLFDVSEQKASQIRIGTTAKRAYIDSITISYAEHTSDIDQAKVDEVIEIIDNIGTPNASLTFKKDLEDAEEAFASLTPAEQEAVTNASTLTSARETFDSLVTSSATFKGIGSSYASTEITVADLKIDANIAGNSNSIGYNAKAKENAIADENIAEALEIDSTTTGVVTLHTYFYDGFFSLDLLANDAIKGTVYYLGSVDGGITYEVISSEELDIASGDPIDLDVATSGITDLVIAFVSTQEAQRMILSSVTYYSKANAENADVLLELLAELDTCTEYDEATTLREMYENDLTDYERVVFNRTNIVDNDKDGNEISVKALEKLEYMEYLAGLEKQTAGLSSNLLSNITSSNNILIILVVGLLGLTSILGYYFLNKKKYAK